MENTNSSSIPLAIRPSIESIPQSQNSASAGLYTASKGQAKSPKSPNRPQRHRKSEQADDAADGSTSSPQTRGNRAARGRSASTTQSTSAQQQRPRFDYSRAGPFQTPSKQSERAPMKPGSAASEKQSPSKPKQNSLKQSPSKPAPDKRIEGHHKRDGAPPYYETVHPASADARAALNRPPNWRANASPFADKGKGKGRAIPQPKPEPEVSSDDNADVLQSVSSNDRPLEAQLKALADSTKPSPSALKTRQELVRQIQRALDWDYNQRKPRRFEVVPFGSSVVGIASSTSDLDLCIIDHSLSQGYRGTKDHGELPRMYDMGFVRNRIQKNAFKLGVKSVFAIRAKVPICKIELHSGLQADINCNEQLGLRNSHMLKCYFQLAPDVTFPLAKFIKFWAKQRRLNDPSGHQGPVSLSSYSYILLMIAYLRSIKVLPNLQEKPSSYQPDSSAIWWQMERRRGRRNQPVQHTATIGYDTSYMGKAKDDWKPASVTLEEATKGFFDFYSKFAFHEHVVSIRHAEPFVKRRHPFELQPTKQASKAAQLAADLQALNLTPDPEEDKDEEESDEDEVADEDERDDDEDQPILADIIASRQDQQTSSESKATLAEAEVPVELVTVFKEPHRWSSDRLAILDPFILSRNTVSPVNMKTADTLQKELARASDLLSQGRPLTDVCASLKREPGFEKGVPFRGVSKSTRRQRNKQERALAAAKGEQDQSAPQQTVTATKSQMPEFTVQQNQEQAQNQRRLREVGAPVIAAATGQKDALNEQQRHQQAELGRVLAASQSP